MWIYLAIPLPALILCLVARRVTTPVVLALSAVVSAAVISLMPVGSRDYTIYLRDFEVLRDSPLAEIATQDPLYSITVWMLSRAGVPLEVILALFAACAVVIKLTAIGRLSRGSTTAIALYACSFIYLHELTQVRAALAIGIWMHALVYLRTHPGRYLLLTALAMTFHLQAALGLLFWLLRPILNNRRSAIGFLMAGLGIVIVGGTTAWFKELGYRIITLIPDPRTEIYLSIAESGVWVVPNPFSVMSILAMVTAIMLTKRQRNQDGLNSSLIRPGRQRLALASTHSHLMLGVLLMLGSVALVLMSSVSVAAFRVSEHFFALIPVGLGLAINRWHPSLRLPLTLTLAAAFLYLFLLHSPYVNDPRLGEPAIDDA